MLSFRGPDSFVVGNLQNHFPAWELIANIAPFDLTCKILLWIKNCVDVHDFFQPYWGGSFDSALPAHRMFFLLLLFFVVFCFLFFLVTHRLVNRLLNLFLMPFLIDLLRTRVISPWGRVVKFPLLIWLCRLCNDNRFLNLCRRSCHFSLIPFYGSLQCKENKILFTIHNFKFTYEKELIYMKVTFWVQLFEGRLALI